MWLCVTRGTHLSERRFGNAVNALRIAGGAQGAPNSPKESRRRSQNAVLEAEAEKMNARKHRMPWPKADTPSRRIRDMLELETAILWARTGAGEVERVIRSCRFQPGLKAFTKLIALCGRSGDSEKALEIFGVLRGMKAKKSKPNAYIYSALIFALTNAGNWSDALRLFEEMKAVAKSDPQCSPSLVTYSSAISACEKGGRVQLAVEFYREMLSHKIQPDQVVFLSLLELCIDTDSWKEGEELLDSMHQHGFAGTPRIYKNFLKQYAGAGDWNRALELFLTLQMMDIAPDADMCASLMCALEAGSRVDMAFALRDAMIEADIELNLDASNALIRTMAKNGLCLDGLALTKDVIESNAKVNSATVAAFFMCCRFAGELSLGSKCKVAASFQKHGIDIDMEKLKDLSETTGRLKHAS